MITQNAYTRKTTEHFKIDDIEEDQIKITAINSTKFERHLARVNRGAKRRLRNDHAVRLARYKSS